MRGPPLLVALLLLTVPLVGCLGGSEDGGEELQKERADVSQTLGGIQGVVTDDAIQPLVGANLTLSGTERSTTTAEDGSFALSRVEPGTYTLVATAAGFVSQRQEVTVRAGEVATVDLILPHEASQEAYTQQLELAGFLECGAGWAEMVAGTPQPPNRFAFAACGALNLQGNTTNDRFMHTFDLDAPLQTVVYELDWESDEPTAFWSILEVRPFTNEVGSRFFNLMGQAPLYTRMDRPTWENMSQNFTEACEDGNEDWCGQNFWDAGWPLQLRVFAHWDCMETPVRACVILQQPFTHYVSAFYNAPAPDGFAVVEGNGPAS